MVEQFEIVSPELLEAARGNPNKWIYVIDEGYQDREMVPPDKIIGAWKVDHDGKIVGGFLPNPKWIATKNPSDYLIPLAKKRPNFYVYEIVKEFREMDSVPLDGIIGAWEVDKNGSITTKFFPNPNYRAFTIR